MFLKRLYNSARAWRLLLFRDELGSCVYVSLWTRLRMLSRGFLGQSSVLYDFRRNDRRDYVTDLERIRMGRVTQKNPRAAYAALLNNKVAFTAIVRPMLRVPTVYVYFADGRPYGLERGWEVCERDSIAHWCRAAGGTLVFKPVAGAKGKGVFFVSINTAEASGMALVLNGEPASVERVVEMVSGLDEYIASEFIRQGEFAQTLHCGSTNTMRVVTMLDPATGRPFIPVAVQRIGTSRSAPVDNWSRGGLSAAIDLETGELSPGASCPQGRDPITWHDVHPDTGRPIAGQRIPEWARICERVLEAASRLPFLPFIAWDLVADGAEVTAVEGNATTDVDLLQIHGPLLRDPRVRAFFRHYRVAQR